MTNTSEFVFRNSFFVFRLGPLLCVPRFRVVCRYRSIQTVYSPLIAIDERSTALVFPPQTALLVQTVEPQIAFEPQIALLPQMALLPQSAVEPQRALLPDTALLPQMAFRLVTPEPQIALVPQSAVDPHMAFPM